MSREIVRADFEILYKLYADKAVKRFNMTGKHPPQLYGVKLGAEPGMIAESFSLNKLAPMFHGGALNKDQLRHLLQQLTTPGSFLRKAAVELRTPLPDIVVQINELWFTTAIRPPEMTAEEFKALPRKAPSKDPERKEAIGVWLHAREYTTMGNCPIVDKPKRHAEFGELWPEDGTLTGRLSMTLDDE